MLNKNVVTWLQAPTDKSNFQVPRQGTPPSTARLLLNVVNVCPQGRTGCALSVLEFAARCDIS